MSKQAVLTFDLEDWFQLTSRRFSISPGRITRGRLRSQVGRILELLARHDTQATFFVLGMTAESCPEAIEDVRAAGHEIGSHGFGHQLVRTLDAETFRADIDRSVQVLRDLCGVSPLGYRAPEFSIDRASFWALDVLLDCGFRYDSSIFPFAGPRYGIADFPVDPHLVATPSGRSIIELPLAVLSAMSKRLPVAGGGYWRLMPAPVLSWAMERFGESRQPVLYFHPAEFDRRLLDLPLRTAAIAQMTLKQNLGRQSVPAKLEALLGRRRCLSVAQYLAQHPVVAPGYASAPAASPATAAPGPRAH
jgi:polysaccharide deacetylase family protein (PEP-CTERM system associated)